jgi:predicted small metal-binding protein
MDDKRQIIAVVSSSTGSDMLQLQIIFTKTTPYYLPPQNVGRFDCSSVGFDFAFSSTHQSTLETCQQFVNHILLPYHEQQIKQLGLP